MRARANTVALAAVALFTIAALPFPSASASSASRQPACTITGTPGNDMLQGTGAADVICGGAGNDVLVGAGGDDVLIGGAGKDVLIGGAGKDVLIGGPGNDKTYAADLPSQSLNITYDDSLPAGTKIQWKEINACVISDPDQWQDVLPQDSSREVSWTPQAEGCQRARADILYTAQITIGNQAPMALDVKALYYFQGGGGLTCTPKDPRLACVAHLDGHDVSGTVLISLK